MSGSATTLGHERRMGEFLRRFDPVAILQGVEVGVFRGDGALALLGTFARLQLYLVDQWLPSPRYLATSDPTAPLVGDETYLDVLGRIEEWNREQIDVTGQQNRPEGVLIRAASVAAARRFHDACPAPTGVPMGLDFVFVDAEHTHEAVLEDCRAWWPKVKSGGWLCGHDYGCDPIHTHVAGVTTAVDQFAKEVGGAVEAPGEVGDFTWWIRKP